jgi:hypothetical protein
MKQFRMEGNAESDMDRAIRENSERSRDAWKSDNSDKLKVKTQAEEDLEKRCPRLAGESEERYLTRAAERNAKAGREAWRK